MTKGWRLSCGKCLLTIWVMLVTRTGMTNSGVSRVKLVDGGYEDVLVAISQDLDESLGDPLILAIKETIQETSRALFRATHGRLYFRKVVILIPKDWTSIQANPSEGENIEDRDILIAEKQAVYGDQPYTEQPEGCGKPGQNIHLTPDFLTKDTIANKFGPRGKLLLQEWAKLRWGVFDEIGYGGDRKYPRFYMNVQEKFVPTLCSDKPVEGRNLNTETGENVCPWTDPRTYNEKCRFQPKNTQTATSSLMSYAIIRSDSVTEFCGMHNSEAPTKQNTFCNSRSVWEVMRDHADFANYTSSSEDLSSSSITEPPSTTFDTKRPSYPSYALVLDYSSSMNANNRVDKMVREAKRWLLRSVALESNVAIVRFSTDARVVKGLTEIVDDDSRRNLANSLETVASGSTCIGCGLLKALEILSGKQNKVILLITDGEETVDTNKVDDVLPTVRASRARVVTIAFGSQASETLEKIAANTHGKTFTVSDVDQGNMMEEAFEGTQTYQPPLANFDAVVEIYSGPGSQKGGTFHIDKSIGRNTVFQVIQNAAQKDSKLNPSPTLTSPSDAVHDNAQSDEETQSWFITVKQAEIGEWRWDLGLSEIEAEFVRVKITSQARRKGKSPITTRAWLSSGTNEVNAMKDHIVIFAEVKQGENRVVNAVVRAIVTTPTDSDPHEYFLLDNGQVPDTMAGDGIYSKYMTNFNGPGRYGVKAEVTDGGQAVVNMGDFLTRENRRKRFAKRSSILEDDDGYVDSDSPEYCCGSVMPLDPDNAESTGSFSRMAVAGSVKIVNVPSQPDFLPPVAVRDFEVTLNDSPELNSHLYNVSLSWTATGDDLDDGIVSDYIIRMSTNRSHLSESTFDETPLETELNINATEKGLLVEAGSQIQFSIIVEMNATRNSPYYFALKAIDDAGYKSPVSNIAVIMPAVYKEEHAPPSDIIPAWSIALIAVAAIVMIIVFVVVSVKRTAAKYEVVQMQNTSHVSHTDSGNVV